MKKLKMDELGRLSVDEFKEVEKINVSILLDNIRSLHNVGSAFRSADAFRMKKIYLSGITGVPPHREIQKTALGATDSVAWEYASTPAEVVLKLKAQGYRIIVIEHTSESVPLQRFTPDPAVPCCLVFGNEVQGVSEDVLALADEAVEIPQAGTKHSLNISVCLGIVLWEIFRKQKAG